MGLLLGLPLRAACASALLLGLPLGFESPSLAGSGVFGTAFVDPVPETAEWKVEAELNPLGFTLPRPPCVSTLDVLLGLTLTIEESLELGFEVVETTAADAVAMTGEAECGGLLFLSTLNDSSFLGLEIGVTLLEQGSGVAVTSIAEDGVEIEGIGERLSTFLGE